MGLCASLIRKHMSLLAPGEIFTTRDCLGYGSRAAVDKNMFSLVRRGILTRLAWGVFVVTRTKRDYYSPLEIAERKALAFGKQYFTQNFEHKPPGPSCDREKQSHLSLSSSSRAAKFLAREEKTLSLTFPVTAEARCAKLLHFGSKPIGRAIRMLCRIGKSDITEDLLISTLQRLGAKDEWEMRMANAWMPYWLSNMLIEERSQIRCARRFELERRAVETSAK